MVIFDIAETKGKYRRMFQVALKRAGFFPLQRSVFVLPDPCRNEIQDAIRNANISGDVLVLETTSLGEMDQKVRTFFHMK